MPKFTSGRWSIAPPIFDGDAIFAPPQEKGRRNEVVAMGILNKADARLIAAAPEMYELLKVWTQLQAQPDLMIAQEKAKDLLARIDGDVNAETEKSAT